MRQLTLVLVLLYCNTASAGIAIGETGKAAGEQSAQLLDVLWYWVEVLKASI